MAGNTLAVIILAAGLGFILASFRFMIFSLMKLEFESKFMLLPYYAFFYAFLYFVMVLVFQTFEDLMMDSALMFTLIGLLVFLVLAFIESIVSYILLFTGMDTKSYTKYTLLSYLSIGVIIASIVVPAFF